MQNKLYFDVTIDLLFYRFSRQNIFHLYFIDLFCSIVEMSDHANIFTVRIRFYAVLG